MRKIATMSSAVALFGAVTFGAMSPASAAAPSAGSGGGAQPSTIFSCSGIIDVQGAKNTAYCGGTEPSEFRAWIQCKSPLLPWTYTNVGPWRDAGGGVTSKTNCGSSKFVDAGVDTRYDDA